eukprot:gene7081-9665_t
MILSNLMAGGAAGGSSLIVSHPFDVARTRLAVDVGGSILLSERKYIGTYDCLKKSFQESGIHGIYPGLIVSLVGAVIFRALFLGGYDIVKNHFGIENSSIMIRFGAAQVLTVVVGTVCYPLDTIKRRLMTQQAIHHPIQPSLLKDITDSINNNSNHNSIRYSGAWDCWKSILKHEGFRGLFSGYSANLIRGISGPFLLVGYDEMKKIMY